MSQLLQDRLNQIRRRVRRAVWVYGLSWLVAVVFSLALAVGLIDWLVHLDDAGVRLILAVGIVASGSWVAWRFLVLPSLWRPSDVDIAIKVERRFPGLKDTLSSSVEFLAHGADPRIGSPELQRRVIERTLRQVERIDVSDVLDVRDTFRAAALALGVCVVTAVVIGLNQAQAETALKRLVFPFADHPWPRQVELQLVDAQLKPIAVSANQTLRVARGQTVDLFVRNTKGPLPGRVAMEYRFENAPIVTEPLRPTTLRDHDGRPQAVAAASLADLSRPLQFRAVGGDDDQMPWYRLDVVPPPQLDSLRVTVTPPAYTGRPPVHFPEGVGHVEGLIGTHVAIQAGVNKPLKSATLRVKDSEHKPISLFDEGRELLTVAFDIGEAGVYSYWFTMQDVDGFENSEPVRYEVRGISDLVPDVYFDLPTTDPLVTQNAEVPLRIVSKDDLGLKDVRLHHQLVESAAPISASEHEAAGVTETLRSVTDRPEQLVVEHLWDLGPLRLPLGSRVEFHAEATDAYDLGPEHVGRSIARVLTVVSEARKLDEFASRQSDLLDEFDRLFKTQSGVREQVSELRLQLENIGRLRPEDGDVLKRIELDQRQIASRLTEPADGVEARIDQLRKELKSNKINDSETELRLEQIADELQSLTTTILPEIERELTHARKLEPLTEPHSDQNAREQSQALAKSEDGQLQVLTTLDEIRKHLAQWRNHRNLISDLQEIISGQESLNQETVAVFKKSLAGGLSSQDKAELSKLRERQLQQAEKLERYRRQLAEAADDLSDKPTDATEAVRLAGDELDRRAVAGTMRDAARQLQPDSNSLGQATTKTQPQVLSDLKELENGLRNPEVSDTETLVKQLKQAESELLLLKQREQDLMQRLAEAQQLTDATAKQQELQSLIKQQQQLRGEAAHLARRLQRLDARSAAASAERATERMQRGEQDLQQDQGEPAAEQLQEALDDLEQAQRELAQERAAAEERLAIERLERIADELCDMIARQQTVIDETRRLELERKSHGNWTRPLLKSLANLATVQEGLKQETDGMVESLQAAEVFALALRGASRWMDTAARRLAERTTDDKTVAAEEAARQRFVDLIAALKPDKDEAQPRPKELDEGPVPPPVGPVDGIPQLAELKMLKTLQLDVNRRTAMLDDIQRRDGQLSPDGQRELEQLADEQGQIADLTRALSSTVGGDAAPMTPETEPPPTPGPEKSNHTPPGHD